MPLIVKRCVSLRVLTPVRVVLHSTWTTLSGAYHTKLVERCVAALSRFGRAPGEINPKLLKDRLDIVCKMQWGLQSWWSAPAKVVRVRSIAFAATQPSDRETAQSYRHHQVCSIRDPSCPCRNLVNTTNDIQADYRPSENLLSGW